MDKWIMKIAMCGFVFFVAFLVGVTCNAQSSDNPAMSELVRWFVAGSDLVSGCCRKNISNDFARKLDLLGGGGLDRLVQEKNNTATKMLEMLELAMMLERGLSRSFLSDGLWHPMYLKLNDKNERSVSPTSPLHRGLPEWASE